MIGKSLVLLLGSLSLFFPILSYSGDWGDNAFQRCWKDDRLFHKPDRSACVYKELEEKRSLMRQLYDDVVREAEKHDRLMLEEELKGFPVDSNDKKTKKNRQNGMGSHAWKRVENLQKSQLIYEAYVDAEKSRVIAYIPGNGAEDAAVRHELNLIQDRITILEKLKNNY